MWEENRSLHLAPRVHSSRPGAAEHPGTNQAPTDLYSRNKLTTPTGSRSPSYTEPSVARVLHECLAKGRLLGFFCQPHGKRKTELRTQEFRCEKAACSVCRRTTPLGECACRASGRADTPGKDNRVNHPFGCDSVCW